MIFLHHPKHTPPLRFLLTLPTVLALAGEGLFAHVLQATEKEVEAMGVILGSLQIALLPVPLNPAIENGGGWGVSQQASHIVVPPFGLVEFLVVQGREGVLFLDEQL
jgi:hypothetical protein